MANSHEAVRDAFNADARIYDRSRRQMVPCFDELYGIAAGLIPFETNRAFEVLDLGAGTGVLSQFIGAKFPHAKILLADIAPEMLKLAQERFTREDRGGESSRITYLVLDHGQDPIPGSFDAIVSGLSIHHLEHDEKRALFARIHSALREGGIFINAEVILGENDAIERTANEECKSAARDAGASESDLAAAIERQKHDRCATLDAQMTWLREIGFRDVAAAYRKLIFAVYSARK
jgi:tRNA (cmo5U34)-methyltransferase